MGADSPSFHPARANTRTQLGRVYSVFTPNPVFQPTEPAMSDDVGRRFAAGQEASDRLIVAADIRVVGVHNESFAYTEVNNSAQAGGDLSGALWQRSQDRVGVAVVSNGLSAPHRQYLALGGQGFLLGDGTLRYGREDILETYYTTHIWRRVSASGGLQYIDHPGYNEDRGLVLVGMLRVHVDF